MSELKVILATPHPKMKNACDGAIEVYSKSEVDKVIAELEQKLEDNVAFWKKKLDDEMASRRDEYEKSEKEIRRIRRALYKACANCAMAESYIVLNDVPTSNRWVHTLRKLKEKLEEYK